MCVRVCVCECLYVCLCVLSPVYVCLCVCVCNQGTQWQQATDRPLHIGNGFKLHNGTLPPTISRRERSQDTRWQNDIQQGRHISLGNGFKLHDGTLPPTISLRKRSQDTRWQHDIQQRMTYQLRSSWYANKQVQMHAARATEPQGAADKSSFVRVVVAATAAQTSLTRTRGHDLRTFFAGHVHNSAGPLRPREICRALNSYRYSWRVYLAMLGRNACACVWAGGQLT